MSFKHVIMLRCQKHWFLALALFSTWLTLSTMVIYWRFEIHSTVQRAIYVSIRPPKDLKTVPANYVNKTNTTSIVWQDFKTTDKQQVFVFSVIASKSERGQEWDHVTVNGWEIPAAVNETYRCCFFYDSGHVTSTISFKKQTFGHRGKTLEARQILCKLAKLPDKSIWKDALPIKMALASFREPCSIPETGQNITYPKLENQGVFAVCGKIVYGDKNAKHLVEWIEYQRYFQADKIVLYPYQDLNMDALKVLQFYVSNGVIEVVPLPYVPKIFESPRYFGVKGNSDMYNDEQVAIFDAQARLWDYKYLAVYDTDEFPVMNRLLAGSYQELMKFLTARYKLPGTFTMRCHFHSLSTNQTNPDNGDLMIARYSRRSDTIIDRPKFIHITDRVEPGSVRIHEGNPIEPYRRYILHRSEVVLKHFRECPTAWNGSHGSKIDRTRCTGVTNDDSMKPIADVIGPNVRKVIKMLGL